MIINWCCELSEEPPILLVWKCLGLCVFVCLWELWVWFRLDKSRVCLRWLLIYEASRSYKTISAISTSSSVVHASMFIFLFLFKYCIFLCDLYMNCYVLCLCDFEYVCKFLWVYEIFFRIHQNLIFLNWFDFCCLFDVWHLKGWFLIFAVNYRVCVFMFVTVLNISILHPNILRSFFIHSNIW